MHFYFSAFLLCLSISIFHADSFESAERCSYALDTSNDGPVTLDVPVTVSASLKCVLEGESILLQFEDDTGRTVRTIGNATGSAAFIYSDFPGKRSIFISAYLLKPRKILVATIWIYVDVYEHLPGEIIFSQVLEDNNVRYASTGTDTNISLAVFLPPPVLLESEFTYSWTVGDNVFITSKPFKVHRFENAGPYLVRVTVVARIPSFDEARSTQYKWGYFEASITAKDPFSTFNITGNTYLQHGQLLNLDISCNGSGPVNYCWKIMTPSENQTNLTCSDPVSVMECNFPIIYYFRDSGDYLLAIYVDNLVSFLQRNIEIHIYDVSLSPQLSTVIIPVVCTVLVVLIVATAVVIHVRRHASFGVETADFNFMEMDEPSAMVAETSWELMRRSLLQMLRIHGFYIGPNGTLVNYGAILSSR